jgi:putative FmdB family regulatory protein
VPTYQYRCTACGEDLEAVQSFSDAPLTECPACGGVLRKVFTPVGVVFKGSGFYRTDSRAKSDAAANGADKGDRGSDPGGDKSGKTTGDKGAEKGTGAKEPAAAGAGSSGRDSGPAASAPPAAGGAGPAKPSSSGGSDRGTSRKATTPAA